MRLTPRTTLAVTTWIGNAAAVLTGPWGAVSAQAHQAGCSRPAAYHHAQRVQQAVAEAQAGGPTRVQLLAQQQALRQENEHLWRAWQASVPFDGQQPRRFVATAAALGLSLNQAHALLACVWAEADCPSRATLGRWVTPAAAQARSVVQVLDRACVPLIQELCWDESYCHRVPVRMGVEPHSLAWVLAQRGPDRSGATWQQALPPWTPRRWVTSDNGTGLQFGLEDTRPQRQQRGDDLTLEVGLDVFHTQREGGRALRCEWSAAERVWEEAEQADGDLAQVRRRGQDSRGATPRRLRAWRQAEQAFQTACRREAAWQRAGQALQLFRPDGRLNDRAWAEAQLGGAVPELDGPRWAQVRRRLSDSRSLNCLDRLQRDLAAACPSAEWREAFVALWRLRHATRPGGGPRPSGAVGVVLPVVQALRAGKLAADWHGVYREVARVLRRVVRASSVVECLNSVVRMQQARHRTLRQPLLDLKRLYWNGRVFAEGQHAEACP